MARVAQNQDRTEAERSHFVYVQHAKVQSQRGHTVLCMEETDTRITPAGRGQTQTLLHLLGHVREGNQVIRYTTSPEKISQANHTPGEKKGDENRLLVRNADDGGKPVAVADTDLDLVASMRRNFTDDDGSKDGIDAGLFPLTSAEQKELHFELKGKELRNGRDTFHLVFRPKDNTDFGWKGDAWIDSQQFEPVVIRTALSRSLPFGVRALLGTNVPGLGFTVVYAPQEGNIWFPASFGSEFKVKVFFFFHRQILVNVENRSFERTHVTSNIHTDKADVVTLPRSEPKP